MKAETTKVTDHSIFNPVKELSKWECSSTVKAALFVTLLFGTLALSGHFGSYLSPTVVYFYGGISALSFIVAIICRIKNSSGTSEPLLRSPVELSPPQLKSASPESHPGQASAPTSSQDNKIGVELSKPHFPVVYLESQDLIFFRSRMQGMSGLHMEAVAGEDDAFMLSYPNLPIRCTPFQAQEVIDKYFLYCLTQFPDQDTLSKYLEAISGKYVFGLNDYSLLRFRETKAIKMGHEIRDFELTSKWSNTVTQVSVNPISEIAPIPPFEMKALGFSKEDLNKKFEGNLKKLAHERIATFTRSNFIRAVRMVNLTGKNP